ncbi:MAG: conjugal transfer protein trbG [Gammaproteobacteria bacterium]|jgi:type IV secretion system protein VirB9|nr:conjugal transfer protein trbG [Gammaproteobacteria bacterium]
MFKKRVLTLFAFVIVLGGCENFNSSTPATAAPTQNGYRFVPPPQPSVTQVSPHLVTVDTKQLLHAPVQVNVVSGANAVDQANKKALIQPSSTRTLNSIIIYPYQAGNIYEIYAAPMNVTDIEMQPGEQIISVAAGDTVRWELSKTLSGADSSRTEHLLIKPFEEDISTTMVITTNQRTYHLLLKSTKNTFMATVQWQYDNQGMLVNNLSGGAGGASSVENGLPSFNIADLDFSYKTELKKGNKPDWMPKAVFNDGLKTYIEFSSRLQSAPALFMKQNGSGDASVNYRIVGNYYVIDQVMTAAELMSGNGETVVEITYNKS